MKKSLVVKLLSALLIVVLIFSLASCGNSTLSAETEMEIKEAYIADKYGDLAEDPSFSQSIVVTGFKINQYLGSYNGSMAVMIRGNRIPAGISYGHEAAGIIFLYRTEEITIYKEGHVYNLPEAYKRGLLTKGDLGKLAKRYYALYPNLHPDYVDITGYLLFEY